MTRQQFLDLKEQDIVSEIANRYNKNKGRVVSIDIAGSRLRVVWDDGYDTWHDYNYIERITKQKVNPPMLPG